LRNDISKLEDDKKELQAQIIKKRKEAEEVESKNKEEIFKIKETIITEKNNYTKLNQSKLKVEREILTTQKTFVTLKEENASQKRTISAKESEISTLIGEREKFKEDLNFELSTHRDTKSRLELQTSLRESENKSSTRRISELEEDLKHEKNLADQVIGKLQKEIAEMKKDFENLRINNEENKKENKALSKKLAKVNSELESANKEIDDNRIKIAIMNEEKEKTYQKLHSMLNPIKEN